MKYINYIKSIKTKQKKHNKKKRKKEEIMNMKFIKGMIMGGIVSAGAVMMYKEMSGKDRKQMIKKGKQFAKKMGIL